MPVFHLNELGFDSITLDVGGREFQFTPLTLGERSKIQAVVRKIVPDPIELAKSAAHDQPVPVANAIWERAIKARAFWPPSLESAEGLALIDNNLEMQNAVIKGSLRVFHQDLKDDEIRQITESLGTEKFAKIAVFAITGKRTDDPNFPRPDQLNQPTGTS